MSKRQKPWFTKEQVEQIISVFKSELAKEDKTLSDAQVEELKVYVQAGKHPHENAVLSKVLDGEYVCTVKENRVAYKVSDDELADVADEKDDLDTKYRKALVGIRRSALKHSIIQISIFGDEKELSFKV